MYAPDDLGEPRLRSGSISYAKLWRTETGTWGAFGFGITGVGYFPECRLMQRKRGGFFASGEWLPDAHARHYPQFVQFEGPFSTWLANACRAEIVAALLEEFGELYPDVEVLALDENEMADRAVPEVVTIEDVVRIEFPKQKGRLVSRRAQFEAVIGKSIRVRGCRLAGRPGQARLVLPTSDGLSLRPIQLERPVEIEIVRRAERLGIAPEPIAA